MRIILLTIFAFVIVVSFEQFSKGVFTSSSYMNIYFEQVFPITFLFECHFYLKLNFHIQMACFLTNFFLINDRFFYPCIIVFLVTNHHSIF